MTMASDGDGGDEVTVMAVTVMTMAVTERWMVTMAMGDGGDGDSGDGGDGGMFDGAFDGGFPFD